MTETADRSQAPALRLSALLAVAGVLHFLMPRPFDGIIPRGLPGTPRSWTHLSGIAEIAVAAAVALPSTRRLGGLAAAGLFAAVFPANARMARDWKDKPRPLRLIALARLPLQIPLVLWALWVARKADA
ncbi:DoxX family protein [Actinocorallia aurea]